MKPAVKESFLKWHSEQKDKVFSFQEEFLKYCKSDVDILRRCSLKFRDIFLLKTGMDPFTKSLTITGACNLVFRKLFLKENTIGIVPHGGYRRNEKQSNVAIKWLKWVSRVDGMRIQHARNDGEQKVGRYKVDGINGNTVFEFNGCYWHGCPKCMPKRNQLSADLHLTAEAAYERTLKRKLEIESHGYRVIEKWECELNRELKTNDEMKRFFDSIVLPEPMDPREAFFGGRTNAVKLYEKIRKDETGAPLERIDYTDICSLYPFICKYGKFLSGHPTIITENFDEISKDNQPYEGLIKARILPPRGLLHPVLPFRCNKKLLFPLCGTCAEKNQLEPCKHSDDERAITGAWVSMEVYKSLEFGYQILDVFEIWHYEKVEKYDPTTKTGGLFAEYQADGWLSWVKTDEDKNRYIREYYEREGVQLNKDEIETNPGLRALAKLMLNSFWGKFGQRNKMSKVTFFTDPKEYFEHIFEVGRIVHSIMIVSDNMVAVTSSMEEEFVEVMGNMNPVIAAYTTAQARLKLYSYIENLQDRLLYFDTDSIIFKSTIGRNEWMPPIGSFLGDMTDELKDYGAGSYIEEFLSGGPKHYAFKVYSAKHKTCKYCMKVRGFSLSTSTVELINFESLKMMIYDFVKNNSVNIVPVHFSRIERCKNRDIISKCCTKNYRIVYDKRIVNNDFSTLPYGW